MLYSLSFCHLEIPALSYAYLGIGGSVKCVAVIQRLPSPNLLLKMFCAWRALPGAARKGHQGGPSRFVSGGERANDARRWRTGGGSGLGGRTAF